MGISRSAYAAYGIRVADDVYEEIDWDRREKIESDLTPGTVVFLTAGAYDQDMAFLVIRESLEDQEPGRVKYVEPYNATDTSAYPYPDWDWALVSVAEKFGLPVLSPPAWMFVLDES
ncbi:hypothetical protein [Streptomyces sp. 5-10]|uniref:hypothetical protein n=1 Tax=Streptomyces sp. 5-10 TaxID=878925 RepID=UPI00168AAD33|nr:hypothetical protein [Streptomyces sp. 5-10]MBD3004818.1 hypothetical protein [Streptomyces sp. 5-10]